MAMTLENSESSDNNGDAEQLVHSIGFSTTSGRLLVLCLSWDKGITGPSVTDNGTGTWTQVFFANNANAVSAGMWYKIAGGDETSITISWTNSHDITLWLGEFSGNASAPLDVSANQSSSGATTSLSTGTTAATAEANELAIALMGSDSQQNTLNGRAWTQSFTEIGYFGTTELGDSGLSVARKDLTATGTVETTFSTTSAGDEMVCGVATFKESSAPPQPIPIDYRQRMYA